MKTYEQDSNEIIQFLEDLQDTLSDLPKAIEGHWQKAIQACKDGELDKATTFCNRIMTVLMRLRDSNKDFMAMDKAQSRVAILWGAINLRQGDWQDSVYFFEQGAKYLRSWGDKEFESLSYFGKALAYKKAGRWTEALEEIQKALDAIQGLSIYAKSTEHTKQLHRRIKQEIDSITDVSMSEDIADGAQEEATKDIKRPKSFKRIPIVSSIAAGLGVITEDNLEDYLLLDEDYHNKADFAVIIVGDSMNEDCILPGDIALIRQQSVVERGEIGAVVITTLAETVGVLKRYYLYEKDKQSQHWFLRSSNSSAKHIVVIPSGANVIQIRNLYAQEIQSGQVEIYEEAELAIAGKYVGLVRKN